MTYNLDMDRRGLAAIGAERIPASIHMGCLENVLLLAVYAEQFVPSLQSACLLAL